MAGEGSGTFGSYADGVEAMVRLERTFEPNSAQHTRYAAWFERYQQLWSAMRAYPRELK